MDDSPETRLDAPSTGEDFTRQMLRYAESKIAELRDLDLDGYVLKQRSPSWGMVRTSV